MIPLRVAFPLSCSGDVLLLPRALLSKLTNHFLAKPRGLGEHVIETVEHLFETFFVDRGAIRHLCGKTT